MIIGLEHVSPHGADGRKWLVEAICPPLHGIQLEWTGLLLAALPMGWSHRAYLLGASLTDVRQHESINSTGSLWDCDCQTYDRSVFCYHCSHCSSLLLQMHPRSSKSIQTGRSCPRPSTEDSWTKASGSVFWKFVWKTSAVHHQLALDFWRRTCKLPSAVSLVVAELTAADFNCSWRSWNTSRPLWWTSVCLKTEKMSLWESNPVEKWWFLCMIYWFLNIGSKKGCGVEGGNLKQQEEANISGGWDRKWTNWCKDNHLLMEQMLK